MVIEKKKIDLAGKFNKKMILQNWFPFVSWVSLFIPYKDRHIIQNESLNWTATGLSNVEVSVAKFIFVFIHGQQEDFRYKKLKH